MDHHEVVAATGHTEALRLFEKKRFDLVMTDLSMGNDRQAGFCLLLEIKALSPETPVILMSGYFPEGMREKAMRAGAKTTLDKPFTADKLLEVMK